ncbi:IPTL-CTERM sorting domain-containing protein [Brevundimonas sp.]|uniref:IPTL-CTERM sorting domain-containing protein n=1 Tax=Brevundimonas sp. TaxID=1871086 RepID=UPI00289F9D4A|nr:IPTL-CTERM sorting domain-containing protein [Brevundimonas sp.]
MKKIIAAAVIAAALSTAVSSALAGTLVNPTVTLSNSGLSQPTAITATHTTATDVPANHFILRFQLPADFTDIIVANQFSCTGVTLKIDGAPQTFGGFDPCGLTLGGFVYVRAPALVPSGSDVEVQLASTFYRTPATPGVKTFTLFQTANGAGNTIDEASPMPSVTINAPAAVPTMTEWAMILLTAALGGFAALTIQRRRRTV